MGVEQITRQLDDEERELVRRLKEIQRVKKAASPASEDAPIDVQYRRLDPETHQETSVLDDLGQMGFRDVLAEPTNPIRTVNFLKNLRERPDLIEKVKRQLTTEEFLEKAALVTGGAILGYWLKGKKDEWARPKQYTPPLRK